MKFAFDLDGILCNIDAVQIQMIITGQFTTNQKEYLEKLYYENKKPTLNPVSFLADGDEFIIVTARAKHLLHITARWMNKYLPGARWFLVDKNYSHPREVAVEKLKVLRKEKVDVYFDDNPKVVEALRVLCKLQRELRDWEEIKIIQFNGKF